MTPKDFTTFLASPENNDFSVEQLEKMLKQYPYTQSLRIAFLRKLKAMNHQDYEKHLHTTATYSYDRVFLRKYINKENIYVVEYPAIKIEAEQLETLDLVPLRDLKREIDTPLLDLETTNAIENEAAFPSSSWENVFNESESESESKNENESKSSLLRELGESENVTTETVEHSDDNHLEENVFNENHNESENESESESENESSLLRELGESENVTTETVEHSEDSNHESPETNHQSSETSYEMKHQKEIQDLILDSQRMKKHAPIEEDIDNLLDEEELEGLDDDIEFEFEIDQQIIGDEDDLSMFDGHGEHGENHHDKHDDEHSDEHSDEHHQEVSEQEDKHRDVENSHDSEKSLHEIIHEKINILTETPPTEEAKHEEIVMETEEDYELSPDNIFSKDDLRAEGGLFFLDDRPEYVDVDDESELPLEEEREIVISTENVNEIRATLSDKHQDKDAKKERIKKYLQRIAQIPAEENGIITETYADLLAKQGKIERSIKMYQQLILNNPQKKVYFAAKIKQLIKNI